MPINAYVNTTGMTTQQQAGLAGAARKKKLNPDGTPVVENAAPIPTAAAPVAPVTVPASVPPPTSISMPEPAQPQETRLGMAQAERMRAAILDQNLRDQNAKRMGYDPQRVAAGNEAAKLRLEIAAGRDSTMSNPDPLSAEQNAARQRTGDLSLANQANAGGYQNAADFFTRRLTGQGPDARAATAISAVGMNPAAGIPQAVQGAEDAAAGYAARGDETSNGQRRATFARDLMNQAARLDYQKRNTDRQKEEAFGTASADALKQAQMAGLASTVAGQNEATAKSNLNTKFSNAAASDEAIQAQVRAKIAQANTTAEGAEIGLEEQKAQNVKRRQDMAVAGTLDSVMEASLPSLEPLSNIATGKRQIRTDAQGDQLVASEKAANEVMRRIPTMTEPAKAAYRQKILEILGSPTRDQFDKQSNADDYSMIEGVVAPLVPGVYSARHEGAQAAKRAMKKLRAFLFPG